MVVETRSLSKDLRSLEGEAVSLIVGSKKAKFVIHEEWLCQDSAFFKTSLKKEWKEGQERLIILPEDEPNIVHLYVQWISFARLFVQPSPKDVASAGEETRTLVSLYVFGEKVQNQKFKDAVIDALLLACKTPTDDTKLCHYPAKDAIDHAFQQTPVGSPLRKLLVDFIVYHGGGNWLDNTSNKEYLLESLKEVLNVRALRSSTANPTLESANSCRYHQHGEKEECYLKKSPDTTRLCHASTDAARSTSDGQSLQLVSVCR